MIELIALLLVVALIVFVPAICITGQLYMVTKELRKISNSIEYLIDRMQP